MKQKHRFLMGLLAAPLAVVAAGMMGGDAFAATKTWIAPSDVNLNFSHGANWSPAGAPSNGDDLVFDANQGFAEGATNDMVNLEVNSITFIAKSVTSGFWCTPIKAVEQLKISGPINGDARCMGRVMNGSYILGADVVAKNVVFSGYTGTGGSIDLNGNKISFVTESGFDGFFGTIAYEGVAAHSTISGNGTVEFNGAYGSPHLDGNNTYSGTTNLIATGSRVKGVIGNFVDMFGTSVVNISGATAAASFVFVSSPSGLSVGNTINITGGQADDLWGALQFYCTDAFCSGTLNVPNIRLLGNTSFEQWGYKDRGFVVNLAGIVANGRCVEYWVDAIASHFPNFATVSGGFLNGPVACSVSGGTGPGPSVPDTGMVTNEGGFVEWVVFGVASSALLGVGAVAVTLKPWVIRKIKI